MVTHRSAKNKGNQFEYDVEFNLKKFYGDMRTTDRKGYVQQYDIISENYHIVIETKFHKSITWNEMVKVWKKLRDNAPNGYECLLIFKTNQQPVLIYDGRKCQNYELIYGRFEKRPVGYTKGMNK